MAAGEYLKAAASNISRAVQAMQQDVHDLEKNLTETERLTREQIDDMAKNIANNQMRVVDPRSTDLERLHRQRENSHLDTEITNRKHELDGHRERTQQQVAAIQRDMQGLSSLSSDLERRASS